MSWRKRQLVTISLKTAWSKGCDPYNSTVAAGEIYEQLWRRRQRHEQGG